MSASVLFDNPGPKARARHRVTAILSALVFVAAVAFALAKFGEKGNLAPEKWTPFLTADIWMNYLLVPGIVNTLKAAGISIVLAGIFGLVFGMGRLSHNGLLRWVSTVVVEFFRSVPVLVLMFFTYYFCLYNTSMQPEMFPLVAVVTGLTLYNGSVVAELLRAGVGGLPKGQSEAGLAIGLTRGQTLRTILLPQAITAMLPALVSQLVVVLKDTALGQIVTYPELLNTFQQIGSYKSNAVPALIVIAAIYVLINYLLTSLAARVEARLRSKGRPTIHPGAAGPGHVAQVDAEPIEAARHHADEEALQDEYAAEPDAT